MQKGDWDTSGIKQIRDGSPETRLKASTLDAAEVTAVVRTPRIPYATAMAKNGFDIPMASQKTARAHPNNGTKNPDQAVSAAPLTQRPIAEEVSVVGSAYVVRDAFVVGDSVATLAVSAASAVAESPACVEFLLASESRVAVQALAAALESFAGLKFFLAAESLVVGGFFSPGRRSSVAEDVAGWAVPVLGDEFAEAGPGALSSLETGAGRDFIPDCWFRGGLRRGVAAGAPEVADCAAVAVEEGPCEEGSRALPFVEACAGRRFFSRCWLRDALRRGVAVEASMIRMADSSSSILRTKASGSRGAC
jgi:hypothetical protein